MSNLPEIMIAQQYLDLSPGWFDVKDMYYDKSYHVIYIEKFEKLVKMGFAERHPTIRGRYRKRETELIEMDFKNCDAVPVDIWLPFDLSDLVEIYPGNMIMIAGVKSSGKTGTLLNIIDQNQNNWDIDYFNSEMGEQELRRRLDLFPYKTIDMWNFKAYRRASNFGDAIQGGTNKLVIIDFLEVHDEFYAVGRELKAIHDNLNGAICVVAIQKNPGCDVGLGGWRSAEVSRLYLSIDRGRVKITDAKNFRNSKENPNGKIRRFSIKSGCQINYKSEWHLESNT